MERTESESPTAERLIEVAGKIFAEKGRSATVREICRAADCSVASVNYYFGDKNQLYLRCVQTACEQKQRLFPLPATEVNNLTEAAELLGSFLQAMNGRIAAKTIRSWHHTLMLREVLSPTDGVKQLLLEPFSRDFSQLTKLLRQLLGDDLAEPQVLQDLSTQVLARCMFLRTGSNLRSLFGLDTEANEDPSQYAVQIHESLLLQIDSYRSQIGLAPIQRDPTRQLVKTKQ